LRSFSPSCLPYLPRQYVNHYDEGRQLRVHRYKRLCFSLLVEHAAQHGRSKTIYTGCSKNTDIITDNIFLDEFEFCSVDLKRRSIRGKLLRAKNENRGSKEEKQKRELSVIKIYQENLILDLKFTHYIEFLY